jgi:hypothetical protein
MNNAVTIRAQAHEISQSRLVTGPHVADLRASVVNLNHCVTVLPETRAGNEIASLALEVAQLLEHSAALCSGKCRLSLALEMSNQPGPAFRGRKIGINRLDPVPRDVVIFRHNGIPSCFE